MLLAAVASPVVAAELRAGIAVVEITPPVPFRMSGYFQERLSTGVDDPLCAKAIVIRQGDESAALVFCDLIGIPRAVSSEARRQASAATGIQREHIAVAATHTHTGPLYYDALRDHFHQRTVAHLGRDPYETIDYRAELVRKIAAAIREANAATTPAEVRSGYAAENRLVFNRRFHMKDGTVRFNPGALNPDIVRPVGPTDPQVGVITLTRPGAAGPRAAIISYALHLDTIGGTKYSADYPKFCEDRLRQEFGPEFSLLFGTGTCGDINHIDVTTNDRRRAPEIGRMLGEAIVQQLGRLEPTAAEGRGLAVRSAMVDVPLQVYSPSDVTEAARNMELIGTRKLPFLEQVKACKIVSLQSRLGRNIPLEVQAFRLNGETAIVTLPGEVFVELGLAIKRASPFPTTLVVELANDSPGYVPTKRAFAEGSYEIVNSQVQPGGGEQLVDAALALLKELE